MTWEGGHREGKAGLSQQLAICDPNYDPVLTFALVQGMPGPKVNPYYRGQKEIKPNAFSEAGIKPRLKGKLNPGQWASRGASGDPASESSHGVKTWGQAA